MILLVTKVKIPRFLLSIGMLIAWVTYVIGQDLNPSTTLIPLSDIMVMQKNVNVRASESTSSEIVILLKQFDEVKVLRKGKKDLINNITDYWYKIAYEQGKTGYVFGAYTSLKLSGQKTIVVPFTECAMGDLFHLQFGEYNFGNGNNNLMGYELCITDPDSDFEDETANPIYIGKLFELVINELVNKVYCDPPMSYDLCIKNVPTIISIKLVEGRLPEIEAMMKTTWNEYKSGQLENKFQMTDSGLKYIIHDPGLTNTRPMKGDQIFVHYYGILDANAKMFDTSFKTGMPYQFPLGMGQVIKGWDEGIALLNKGSKATIFIPSSLGFGPKGITNVIPENADLIFYIELQ